MPNIADIIEEYIKTLINRSNGVVRFRRSELAEKFDCVPSQINYVLSTRFSAQRGYIVETRRGGGGYIRIIRVPLKEAGDLLNIIQEKIGNRISVNDSVQFIRYLLEEELVTRREAHLMQTVIEVAAPEDGSAETDRARALLLKSMLMVLLRHRK